MKSVCGMIHNDFWNVIHWAENKLEKYGEVLIKIEDYHNTKWYGNTKGLVFSGPEGHRIVFISKVKNSWRIILG